MARLPYLDVEDLPEEHRDLLRRRITLHRALVHSIGGARAFGGLGQWIRYGSKLDPRLREMAILQVGWLARSPYEWSHHVKIGYDFGVTDRDIAAIATETDGGDSGLAPLDRLVLRGAREMTADGAMAEETFTALQAALGDELVVELTIAVAFYCGVVRLLATLGIDVEPEYRPYLDRFPLP